MLSIQEKGELQVLLASLGQCAEVEEVELEAYAVVTAMGPAYLWLQWQELRDLAESFGMSSTEADTAVAEMVAGAAKTLFGSGISVDEVMDPIPAKPLGEEEKTIRATYRAKRTTLYEKLKS